MKLMVLLLTLLHPSTNVPNFGSAKHFSHPDGGSQPTKTATTPKYQHTFSGATDRRPSAVGLKAPLVLS